MKFKLFSVFFVLLSCEGVLSFLGNGVFEFNLFKCMWQTSYSCPHEDIVFRLYTPIRPRGKIVDVRSPLSFAVAGYQPQHETAIIIHGFNGTENAKHIRYLRDAYVHRDFNVITVDWQRLTYYPCYLSSLSHTKLVAQCTAQMYAFLSHKGKSKITCVGHSLGAHICGMMKNHLTSLMYKIIGLDPARPLIENHASRSYRLTRDDAKVVQVIHTNAGGLGQNALTGSVDFCINGGQLQPFCKGHMIRRARCSHFLSVCYLANALFKHKKFLSSPCPSGCVTSLTHRLPVYSKNPNTLSALLNYMHIGQDTPDDQTGTYCVQVDFAKHCPFNEAN